MLALFSFCVLLILHHVCAVPTFHSLWSQARQIFEGSANWADFIPSEWLDHLLNIPGSGYVVAAIYWLRHPVLLCLMLPLLIVLFIYCTILIVHMYRLRYWLVNQWARWWPLLISHPPDHLHTQTNLIALAQLLKRLVAALWDAHGRIFHGYEIVGMDKLPTTGPAFVVYYHGTCPFDAYYLISRYCIQHDRFPVAVVDRFLFRMPGMNYMLNLMGVIEGSVEECAVHLNPRLRDSSDTNEDCDGDVLLLAPGGVREALFADERYSILWGGRTGFARVAILANQPIYPMFTENIRETIRVVQCGKSWLRRLYERTRLPLAIFYGYFPVKLRTYIGDPIYPFEGESPECLVDRTRAAIERLIDEHQFVPSNLFCAILQRIPAFDRWFKYHRHTRHFPNHSHID